MTEKHPLNCDESCGHFSDYGKDHDIFCLKFCKKYNLITEPIFRNQIKHVGCASHTSAITLTPSLSHHYTERSQATGKPVSQLVLQDLAALHKKRVAREEKRVWKEIEFERL